MRVQLPECPKRDLSNLFDRRKTSAAAKEDLKGRVQTLQKLGRQPLSLSLSLSLSLYTSCYLRARPVGFVDAVSSFRSKVLWLATFQARGQRVRIIISMLDQFPICAVISFNKEETREKRGGGGVRRGATNIKFFVGAGL